MLYEKNRVCVLLPLQLFPKLAKMLDMDKLANSSHIGCARSQNKHYQPSHCLSPRETPIRKLAQVEMLSCHLYDMPSMPCDSRSCIALSSTAGTASSVARIVIRNICLVSVVGL
jgi:hypothetical protein